MLFKVISVVFISLLIVACFTGCASGHKEVAEFVSCWMTTTTEHSADGTLLSSESSLIEFELEDGTKVGLAIIKLENGTRATAIIEDHLLGTTDFDCLAVVEPIEPIEIKGDTATWKVVDLKNK